ncbi:GNAT family N-acetyltransferase [Hymenobacter jeollabukensis]|uniref:N-acetyltransferase n=1 Tax=Hymenobacter jeollabukensis TaxID=2025313 RepID=A0A5R8WPV9_9BACT|nr:N-acetyltransferase [Hymenobacter jeollabukensis]TLM91772.1 N-acetyltransferase [Hymenobacter jeollabukensis]
MFDLLIRPETPADYPAVATLLRAAFPGPGEAHLVEQLRRRPDYTPELALVATLGGEVVGHILLTPIDIESVEGGASRPSLALAPVAVQPAQQRRGIGAELVEAGLAAGRSRGHESVILLGHPAYYPRFGFAPASLWGVRAPFEVPDKAFMALELRPGALARAAGTVRYPPEFASV